ncbi:MULTISPECIES: glutathione ABC transporter substrate-binding protein [Bacillaceae]|uniref:Glutathione ABC transporter substrate-binding protein n=1 Tax=Evansella alkalicola TaxID=745819 RepID=A0ABS6JYA2_9BACI|nr:MULTISPECIES: glutathione ABC transporter substrate-binding protein [Bacillaceae]MBU9723581.1 glutathione ABC transporter substrate-binding protein [Bacillus alkalicola]
MKAKNLVWFFALMLGFALVLSACAGDGEVETDSDDADTGTETEETDSGDDGDSEGDEAAVDTDDNHLIIAVSSDLVSLDPHGNNDVPSSNVRSNIYETLVKQDENMEIVEGLAEAWEPVGDNSWKFTLREGVQFHDGSEFTAEVVKANLERILDPAIGSPRSFLYDMLSEVTVESDYEVVITTEYPFAPLLAHLAHDAGGMLSLEVIEEDYTQAIAEAGLDLSLEDYYELRAAGGDDFEEVVSEIAEYAGLYVAQNPVGTGYFQLGNRVSGEQTVLTRFDGYWGEPAKAEGVTFKVVPEPSARVAELETGYSHIADPIQPTDKDHVDNHEATFMNVQESVSLSYVSFNTEKAPFDDPRVRQAVSLAINQEEIIEGIYQGNGIPAIGPLAPDVFGYDPNVEGLLYDLDRAQELLEEAGYGDGFSTTIWTNDNEQREETALYVQHALQALNIDVEIEVLEWGAYLERTAAGEHDMFILGWSTVTADADYGMYALLHSSMHGDPGNRAFLTDDRLDELLDQGRRETDPDARQAIYSEAQELLVELAPMIYVHHQNYLTGVRNEVEGFWVDALGIYQLKDVTLN